MGNEQAKKAGLNSALGSPSETLDSPMATQGGHGPRKILIVDDDEINSAALAKRLARRGLQVTTTPDPLQVWDLIKQEEIELMMLDIVMPKMDGIALLEETRSRFSKYELPVIMVTALDDSFDIVDAFKLGANDYITKPVNVDVAIARINAHLSIIDLHHEGARKKELEAINAMVTTYNHEINNPLAIALGALSLAKRKSGENPDGSVFMDRTTLDRTLGALERIAAIVKQIKEVSEATQVPFENHASGTKLVKVR